MVYGMVMWMPSSTSPNLARPLHSQKGGMLLETTSQLRSGQPMGNGDKNEHIKSAAVRPQTF